MRILFSVIVLFSLSIISAFSQDDKILMTIGDQQVTVGEFERIYNKNNVAGLYEKQPVDEYLDLFINFKLKVIEAEKLGMDTVSKFINELKGYRDQLAKPYLNDSLPREALMKQQYERMKYEMRVSHILIRLDLKASPEDTLAAYNKIIEIRNKIIGGEKFDVVAKAYSEDPTASKNGGDIGWMTAFRTIWEFENTIYGTPVGQVSMPVRTAYGYHILRVSEKRQGNGTVHIAHIYVRAPEDMAPDMKAAAEKKIYAIYDSLKMGREFAELAKNNSDDRSSANSGGVLNWFGSGQMIPDFENAAFALQKPGDFSKPVHSYVGWHILQLLEKKGLGSYEETRPELLSRMAEAPMVAVMKNNYNEQLKKQYNYNVDKQNLQKFFSSIDSSVFSGKWNDSIYRNNREILFSYDSKKATVADFAAYLKKYLRKTEPSSIPVFLNEQFNSFSEYILGDHEKELLVNRYPEFKNIMQEYHDGILLFDLTDKLVWSKAVQDTVGLKAYYEANKSQYVWGKRADVMIFSSDSVELVNAAKALAVKYGKKKKFNSSFVLNKLCANDSLKNCIDIKSALYEKGDNEQVDKTNWKTGAGENYTLDGKTAFVFVKGVREPQIKKLDEAKGLITADYQNFLEKAWIAELRARYPVEINKELLKTIK